MRELGLFAGAGGGLLASSLLGWRTVCAVELEPYCQRVLRQRQLDGCLDPFPIWDDIRTFDGKPWRGAVDVVSGGFPCQDISSAGNRAGLAGNRSGLWFEMLRVIGEVRPSFVFAENSPDLRTRGLATVLAGLAGLGYDAAWGVLGAWHVGAPHRRNRLWIVASNPNRCGQRELAFDAEMACAPRAGATDGHANGQRQRLAQHEPPQRAGNESSLANADCQRPERGPATGCGLAGARRGSSADEACWWGIHRFAGVDDGVASRVERVRATGNGQVPAVAALAWQVLRP